MVGRRFVLVAGLLVAVAIVGCSQLPTTMIPSGGEGELVVGEPVALETVRLYEGTGPSNIAYEFEAGRVYEGTVNQGQAVLFFDGDRIYRGNNQTGEILFNRDGNRLFVGANTSGAIAYTFEGDRIFEGTSQGQILYTVEGDRMFAGPNTTGSVVFEAAQPLTGDVVFLLPILAEQRY